MEVIEIRQPLYVRRIDGQLVHVSGYHPSGGHPMNENYRNLHKQIKLYGYQKEILAKLGGKMKHNRRRRRRLSKANAIGESCTHCGMKKPPPDRLVIRLFVGYLCPDHDKAAFPAGYKATEAPIARPQSPMTDVSAARSRMPTGLIREAMLWSEATLYVEGV